MRRQLTAALCFTYYNKNERLGIMSECSNLYFLSMVACRLAECLSEEEAAALSADLMTLGDMLASVLARRELCRKKRI